MWHFCEDIKIISIKLCKVVVVWAFLQTGSYAEQATNLKYSLSGNGLNLYFGERGKLKLGADLEGGVVRDGALYSSFGLEAQIYHLSKLVINLDGEINSSDREQWLFKLDLAPLYNSIEFRDPYKHKKDDKEHTVFYGEDSNDNKINGTNFYNDWYKNLGSRIYYLGNVPLIESYVAYKNAKHKIKFGRMKSPVGLEEQEVFWGDDGKFGPMGHWLTRDLLSGISYGYADDVIATEIGVYSGSNPMKGYSNYLDRVESSNIKSNNTPTIAGKVTVNYSSVLPESFHGSVYLSHISNTTGSTWYDDHINTGQLNDGKRNADATAIGVIFDKYFDNRLLSKLRLFGQYNKYKSGLKSKSLQNDGHLRFREINQSGFFVGTELNILADQLSIGAAYEIFDRFDYNLYEKANYVYSSSPYAKAKQFSRIYSLKYKCNSAVSIVAAYHNLSNPALNHSDILDTFKTGRAKLTMNVQF